MQWPDYHIWRWWGWWWSWRVRDHSSNLSFNILSAWHHWIFLVWPSGQKHWCLTREAETFPVIFLETAGDSYQNMIIFQTIIKCFLDLSQTRTMRTALSEHHIERNAHCQHLSPEFTRINVDDVSANHWHVKTLLLTWLNFPFLLCFIWSRVHALVRKGATVLNWTYKLPICFMFYTLQVDLKYSVNTSF